MLPFPEWSDLGKVSTTTRNSWEEEVALRQLYFSYFNGDVFKQKVPIESGPDEDAFCGGGFGHHPEKQADQSFLP